MHGAFKEWTQMQLLETDVINRLLGLLLKKNWIQSPLIKSPKIWRKEPVEIIIKKKLTGSIQGR